MTKLSKTEIEKCIFIVRKQKVMLDSDLARTYGVSTKILNQAVKRNSDRFPQDFMFQLSAFETENLRSQFVTSSLNYGGRRYHPYVFTEHGAWMLGHILRSPIAIETSIQVVRAFIRLREMIISHNELSKKLSELEKKFDSQFKVVFKANEQLMVVPEIPQKKIGI
ncbi:MAG: ORF6N domain-containing protein [Pedobacter sp.]|nr:ORF6N domain-containing protein [Pedobacter sp.]